MTRKCRIGLIGCGRVAQNHRIAINRCPDAELVAVSNWRMPHAEQVARDWGIRCMTPEALCSSDEIDAVFVLTNSQTHLNYVRMALMGGKHVLVEKPVALNEGEVREMIRLKAQYGRILAPGHSYIYLPELMRMKRVMDARALGMPISMFMKEIYFMPDQLVAKYSGPIREVLCHQIYLMLAYLGKPVQVSAFSGLFRKELFPHGDETVSVNVLFESGAIAHLYVSWAGEDETSTPQTFSVKLLGTQGGLDFSRRTFVRLENGTFDQPMYQEMFDCEVAHFARCVLTGDDAFPSTMEDAALAIRILEKVILSIQTHTVESIE